MEYLPPLMLAWAIQWTGVISPGPSVALILGIATEQGRSPALVTVLGIGSASLVLASATVIGITALFAQVAELMTAIRILGAAYLLWLAYGAFRKAVSPPPLSITQVTAEPRWRLWRKGFLLQVSNPKAILFWLAIASIGGIGDAPLPIIVLFVLVACLNSVLGHGAWALVLSAAPMRRAYQSARRWVEATLGAVFAFAAFTLATARN